MSRDPRADPNCPLCRGVGSTIENEKVDGDGYWCMFVDCDCIAPGRQAKHEEPQP